MTFEANYAQNRQNFDESWKSGKHAENPPNGEEMPRFNDEKGKKNRRDRMENNLNHIHEAEE